MGRENSRRILNPKQREEPARAEEDLGKTLLQWLRWEEVVCVHCFRYREEQTRLVVVTELLMLAGVLQLDGGKLTLPPGPIE